ncbi:hypothetical protein V495_03215 [Pseudogymnoascus sp. VKM F-4514 (FW-929)]|nr:hypothetical protein V495_03215 [Pseudogymnoascus sp. VKM F-4514 (FW-929)]KFY63442.1 hypothetical protein V497_02016 [Pseudogymnoascus sp. VKM F-4516 (FW-969)]
MQISKIGRMDLVIMYSSAEEVHINEVDLTFVTKEKTTYFVQWGCRVMQGSDVDAVDLLALMTRLFPDSCTWRTVNKKLVEGERQLWGGIGPSEGAVEDEENIGQGEPLSPVVDVVMILSPSTTAEVLHEIDVFVIANTDHVDGADDVGDAGSPPVLLFCFS